MAGRQEAEAGQGPCWAPIPPRGQERRWHLPPATPSSPGCDPPFPSHHPRSPGSILLHPDGASPIPMTCQVRTEPEFQEMQG